MSGCGPATIGEAIGFRPTEIRIIDLQNAGCVVVSDPVEVQNILDVRVSKTTTMRKRRPKFRYDFVSGDSVLQKTSVYKSVLAVGYDKYVLIDPDALNQWTRGFLPCDKSVYEFMPNLKDLY